MTRTARTAMTVLLLALNWAPAAAQESRRPSLTISGPAAIGMLIPLGERLALRPDFGYSRVNSSSSITTNSVESWAFAVGVSTLHYRATDGPVRTYLVPRLAYRRSGASGLPGSSGLDASFAFGAQGLISERFVLFGESGVSFSYSESRGRTLSGGMALSGTSRSSGIVGRVGLTIRL